MKDIDSHTASNSSGHSRRRGAPLARLRAGTLDKARTVLVACSDGAMQADTGMLGMALTATAPSGNHYRLRNAVFHVTGASSVDVSSEDDLGAGSIHVQLAAGNYIVTLDPAWYLERSRPGGTFDRVDAILTSSASQTFTIVAHQTTNVVYRFEVSGEVIEMSGDLVIGIIVRDPWLVLPLRSDDDVRLLGRSSDGGLEHRMQLVSLGRGRPALLCARRGGGRLIEQAVDRREIYVGESGIRRTGRETFAKPLLFTAPGGVARHRAERTIGAW